ncbi:hypothetical protein [Histidinibacterium lentulum]|nr:hypothetical protein [Histidinibacterium lentulum]
MDENVWQVMRKKDAGSRHSGRGAVPDALITHGIDLGARAETMRNC